MSGVSLSRLLPPLPGFTALGSTYAPWPVWSGSVANPVRFVALGKKAAVRLWHRARDLDRGTHQPGHHGGAVGPAALAVLHSLIFDFLNHRTGRLDPSYTAIAARAGVCVRTVATALARLRELGILNWVRRCAERWADGRFGWSRRPTPTACCRRASGRATSRLRSRRNRNGGGRPSCPPRSFKLPWRATWRARCRHWPATPRTGWRPPWHGSGTFLARNA